MIDVIVEVLIYAGLVAIVINHILYNKRDWDDEFHKYISAGLNGETVQGVGVLSNRARVWPLVVILLTSTAILVKVVALLAI